MSHINRRVALCQTILLACGLALGGCDDGGTDADPAVDSGAGGKADDNEGAGPVGTLSAGARTGGFTAAGAINMYVVNARPGSVVQATVEREDGDLDPTAFMFHGLFAAQENDFTAPSHGFSNTDDSIQAGWEVPSSGELLLVIGAAGSTAGRYTLDLDCHDDSPVPCTFNGVEDEIEACEFVRVVWLECFEAEDESADECNDWLGIEDTTEDDDCCELWEAEGLPSEEFCG